MQSQLTKIRYSKWFWTVWLFWFLVWFGWFGFSQPYSYLGWTYKLDITQETEIRHTDSTHKNRIIQGVLNSLVDIWFGWFGFSQPYDCLWWKYNLDITQKAIIWHAGLTHKNMLTQGVLKTIIPSNSMIIECSGLVGSRDDLYEFILVTLYACPTQL